MQLHRFPAFIALLLNLGSVESHAGLLAYYPFDSNFADASGNGNNLSVAAGTPNITSALGEHVFGGGALDLDKAFNEYLTPSVNFSFATSDTWSVSFWAKRRVAAGAATGMVVGDNTTTDSFIWLPDNSSTVQGLRFRPVGVGTSNNSDYATGHDGNFHHWVVVANGSGTIRVYRDNVDLGTRSPSGGTDFDIKAVGSGYTGTGQIFDGQIDELYIYDEAINAAKVNALFNGVSAPPLAYYPFDSNFTDASGNGNNLTIAQGSPTITATSGESVAGGGALDLDSTTTTQEFLNLTSPITFGATDPWSVSFWARRRPGTDVASGMVLGNPANTTDFIWVPDNSTQVQGLRYRSSTNQNANFGGFPDDGKFHHWVVISDGAGTISAYRDGAARPSVTATGGFSITSVGQAFNSALQSMDGQIDELYIYGEAISVAKVNELYAAGSTPPTAVTRLRVYLLGGQSNADGRADPADLPTSPVNLQQPQADVDFYQTALTTLRPLAQFGPEITLGRRLADSIGNVPGTRVAIIKYGVSGTSLEVDWKAGGNATTTGDGPRYVSFQTVVTNGLAALAAAYPGASIEIDGMIWVQGERDCVTGVGANYQANLTAFIADVRATYGAALPFMVSRLSSGQTSLDAGQLALVRAAQTAVAAADPLSILIDTDTYGIKTDLLHFDASGQQALGNVSAGGLLSFLPFTSPPTMARLGNGDIEITVANAFPGFLYTLENTGTLLPGGWSGGDSETASVPTLVLTHTPGVGETKRFFRVKRTSAP